MRVNNDNHNSSTNCHNFLGHSRTRALNRSHLNGNSNTNTNTMNSNNGSIITMPSTTIWCRGASILAIFLLMGAVQADAFLTGTTGSSNINTNAKTTSRAFASHKMKMFREDAFNETSAAGLAFLEPPVRNGHHQYVNGNANANTATLNGKTKTTKLQQERSFTAEGHRRAFLKADYDHHDEVLLNKNNKNGHHKDDDKKNKIVPVQYVAETKLPTAQGDFNLRAYRVINVDNINNNGSGPQSMADSLLSSPSTFGFHQEPTVLYAPGKSPLHSDQPVPVRIHDQCVTSEVFGSQRCDCREQLQMALQFVQEQGGCVIYLQQEGRGIGLANKVAAYALQDQGMDTVDANLHLGFPEDMRDYGVIPSILKEMGITGGIQLMTNNPRKVEILQDLGVDVHQTIPMVVPEMNQHNRRYLETKRNRMRHSNLSGLFSSSSSKTAATSPIKDPSLHANKNGIMAPKVSLRGGGDNTEMVEITIEQQEEAGVVAKEDGYCFGRQSVVDAVEATARGEMVVVVDDMDRENEGDFIMAAEKCMPEDMATIIRYSSGVICIAMEGDRLDELELPPMLINNQDPKGTAFAVTVDASKDNGITTGISASERSLTVRLLADPTSTAVDFSRPGHILPLRARDGGVLERDGHTEASVDLAKLAGLEPAGVLCEMVSEENPTEMMRLPEIKRFCKKHGFVLTSIADIAQYRRDLELQA